jgi:hypothetical protein
MIPVTHNLPFGVLPLQLQKRRNMRYLVVLGLLFFTALPSYAAGLNIQVAYADTVHSGPFFTPLPFFGQSDGQFLGNGGPFDAGVLKLANGTAQDIVVSNMWVEIGGVEFHPWDALFPFVVVKKSFLVATQTNDPCVPSNFDTSGAAPGGCGSPSAIIPLIHIVADGVETVYGDVNRVLNTGGLDPFDCFGANEGHKWEPTIKVP